MLRILHETAAEGHCHNRFCGSKRGLLILNSQFSILHSPLINLCGTLFLVRLTSPPPMMCCFSTSSFFIAVGGLGRSGKLKKYQFK